MPSPRHYILKKISKKILEEMGYEVPSKEIPLEVVRPYCEIEDLPLWKRKVLVDVLGTKLGSSPERVVVECGKCYDWKLISLASAVDLVILWPSPVMYPTPFLLNGLNSKSLLFMYTFGNKARVHITPEVLEECGRGLSGTCVKVIPNL